MMDERLGSGMTSFVPSSAVDSRKSSAPNLAEIEL